MSVQRDGPEWKPSGSGAVLMIGNGGSAAIAEHITNDLNKSGRPALHPSLATLTCFANDYGWEKALERWVDLHLTKMDTLIAISSSGQSKNILNAALAAGKDQTITLSGFKEDNPLRKLGRTNYYVPSDNYGIVELTHEAILHSIVNPGEL